MTSKEAIEKLKWVKKRICDITYSPESFEALDFAIKALMAYRDCKHCTHNIKIGNMRGCELGNCDFEDMRGNER